MPTSTQAQTKTQETVVKWKETSSLLFRKVARIGGEGMRVCGVQIQHFFFQENPSSLKVVLCQDAFEVA